MTDVDADEQLEYFIAHVRLLLDGKTMEGLAAWAQRFSELRQISQFDLCQQLVNAIRTADLPEHGLGLVRYGEGWLYDRMGKWQDAIKAYKASLTAFQQSGIPLDATLLTQIGSVFQDQGDWSAAEEAYQQALAAATDAHARALILNNVGNLALLRDDLATAEEHYREARELLHDCDERNFAAATHGLAAVLLGFGRLQESQDMQVECLAVFQSLGDMNGVGSAVGGIATAQLYAGHYREAIHNYQTALQFFLEANDHVGTTRTLNNLAIAHWELDDEQDTALEYLTQAIEGYREVGDRHGEATALVNLVRLHHKNNDPVGTRTATDTAKAVCEQYGFLQELLRLPPELQ